MATLASLSGTPTVFRNEALLWSNLSIQPIVIFNWVDNVLSPEKRQEYFKQVAEDLAGPK